MRPSIQEKFIKSFTKSFNFPFLQETAVSKTNLKNQTNTIIINENLLSLKMSFFFLPTANLNTIASDSFKITGDIGTNAKIISAKITVENNLNMPNTDINMVSDSTGAYNQLLAI